MSAEVRAQDRQIHDPKASFTGEEASIQSLDHGHEIPSSSDPIGVNHNLRINTEQLPEVVPEERRVRVIRFYCDMNLRMAQLEYTQGKISGNEEVIRKHHTLKW